jgi:hypothetical protein
MIPSTRFWATVLVPVGFKDTDCINTVPKIFYHIEDMTRYNYLTENFQTRTWYHASSGNKLLIWHNLYYISTNVRDTCTLQIIPAFETGFFKHELWVIFLSRTLLKTRFWVFFLMPLFPNCKNLLYYVSWPSVISQWIDIIKQWRQH